MPHYSVATTKDNLASLIDKALAGEEVVITRHGKPTVRMQVVEETRPKTPQRTKAEWMDWLRERRKQLPELGVSGAELVRKMREEGAH
jgi:prevent-host-death family protein